jgi:hypothetical protein
MKDWRVGVSLGVEGRMKESRSRMEKMRVVALKYILFIYVLYC